MAARSLEKAQTFAKKFDIPKAYGSYEDMANDDDLGNYNIIIIYKVNNKRLNSAPHMCKKVYYVPYHVSLSIIL